MKELELQDRVALITAAGSGMGRASAKLMASEGASVIVADRDASAAKAVVEEIEDAGGRARYALIDVSDVRQIRDVMDMVGRDFGHLDVLYNHAGIPGATGRKISEDEFNLAIDVNLKGAYFGTQLALPLLEASPHTASVIFTSSVSGIVGSPLSPLYSMTKGGVVLLAKSLAIAFAPKIRVNSICPGPVDTPMLPQFFGRDVPDDVNERMDAFVNSSIPLGRRCRPEEIAEAALWLASDRASYVTGIALPVDGGFLAK